MEYIESTNNDSECIFCIAQALEDSAENLIAYRGARAYVILNRFPYTSGHVMVVPFEHQASLEGLDPPTRAELIETATLCMTVLRNVYNPQAFNIGVNIGEAAGAGVKEHVHIHVVPRWAGDTNFMSVLGESRVLPELLSATYERIKRSFDEVLMKGDR